MPYAIFVFYSIIAFILGTCIGSFANVCIYRMPLGRSVIVPRSHCPDCGALIAWFDNIPLLSLLFLGGRCRACTGEISRRYFLVELLTGALFLVVFLRYGFDVRTLVYWLVATGLIIATFIDFDYMIIPDQITIGGIFAGLLISIVFPQLHGVNTHAESFRTAFVGMLIGGMSLWLVGELGRLAFRKEAMGMGDVKLLAALGAFLGWQAVVFTIMIASLAGALAGLAMVLCGRKGMGSKIPFGPYLALAAIVWMAGGSDWWSAYLGWLRSAS
ncbi:MAG: prepilin peptidase [Kiritimatiellae bacterium]|nr:prepilin peptidase [Kiritimatiellia bacterium]